MHHLKWLFNYINYGGYCLYSFTLIDVVKKVIFDQFYLSNANNFVQFIASCIVAIFGFYKLKTYIRDSETKSKILEQELIEKQNENFYKKFTGEFIAPFKNKEK
jgi:predicted membrane protein